MPAPRKRASEPAPPPAASAEDARSAKTPAQTQPHDDPQRAGWFDGPDVVTAIRELDGDHECEYTLPDKLSFTLGASRSRDIAIRGRDLSALHCLFERKGDRLRVHDQQSTNGMYTRGRRVEVMDLHPGDIFTLVPVTFYALNNEMRASRQIIMEVIGAGATPSPDRTLVDAVKRASNLLLTGALGCDSHRLARAIHDVSLRRTRPCMELSAVPESRARQQEILKSVSRGTLVLDLRTADEPLDPTFCSMLFFSTYNIRTIVLASTTNPSRRLLPVEILERMQSIWIRPLAERPGDILELLDRIFVERGAALRAADLSPANRQALSNAEWRDNFLGLRLAAERLSAMARSPGWDDLDWRRRAATVSVPRSTFHDWFTGLGLSSPLLA